MGRIRTVKPELLKHEDLFELERTTGLPMRIAFVGLFTVCDREGRFKWRPRSLKLDVLPYDECDFSRVLDALFTRGFIRKYVLDDEEYGVIPTWHLHQVINNRESASEIPEPTESSYVSTGSTRGPRVKHASGTRLKHAQGEGKGKEGKGKGKEGEGDIVDPTVDPVVEDDPIVIIFAYWQKVMKSPGSALDKPRRGYIEKALKNYTPREVCEAIRGCSMTPHNMGINDRNEKYNGLNVVLKNADNIDRFIRTARAKPNGHAIGADQTEAERLADVQAALDRMNGTDIGNLADDPNTIDMEQ